MLFNFGASLVCRVVTGLNLPFKVYFMLLLPGAAFQAIETGVLGTDTKSNGACRLTCGCIHSIIRRPSVCHRVLTIAFAGGTARRVGSHVLGRVRLLTSNNRDSCLRGLYHRLSVSTTAIHEQTTRIHSGVLRSCSHFAILAVSAFFRHVLHTFVGRLNVSLGCGIRVRATSILAGDTSALVRRVAASHSLRH